MHDLRSSFVIYIKSHPLTKFPRRETLDPFIDLRRFRFAGGGPKKVIFVMFFKAIALLLAAIVGYYIFDIKLATRGHFPCSAGFGHRGRVAAWLVGLSAAPPFRRFGA